MCGKFKRTEEFATRMYDKFPHKEHLIRTREDDLYRKCQHCYKRKMMLQGAKLRSKQKKLEFNLTIKDIVLPEYCPVLGIKFKLDNEKLAPNSPTLDRIDNTKGYTKDNIIVVSMKANFTKGNSTIEELGKIYFFYKKLEEIKNNT